MAYSKIKFERPLPARESRGETHLTEQWVSAVDKSEPRSTNVNCNAPRMPHYTNNASQAQGVLAYTLIRQRKGCRMMVFHFDGSARRMSLR